MRGPENSVPERLSPNLASGACFGQETSSEEIWSGLNYKQGQPERFVIENEAEGGFDEEKQVSLSSYCASKNLVPYCATEKETRAREHKSSGRALPAPSTNKGLLRTFSTRESTAVDSASNAAGW